MPVYAKAVNPVIKDNIDFEMNPDSWMALWMFVCETCNDMISEKSFITIIEEDDSIKMAKRLEESVKSKKFIDWKNNWNKSSEYVVETEDLEKFINFCGFSGGFFIT